MKNMQDAGVWAASTFLFIPPYVTSSSVQILPTLTRFRQYQGTYIIIIIIIQVGKQNCL